MFKIFIKQSFETGVEQVFEKLSDHETFGQIIGQRIKRTRCSDSPFQNGVGSVRRITPFPGGAFEETVTGYEPNALIEYKVTMGSPIKNHQGRLVFEQENGITHLEYSIEFEPKLPLPGWGRLLSWIIRTPIEKGLSDYADTLG